jgi:hypothetical protein
VKLAVREMVVPAQDDVNALHVPRQVLGAKGISFIGCRA